MDEKEFEQQKKQVMGFQYAVIRLLGAIILDKSLSNQVRYDANKIRDELRDFMSSGDMDD